MRPAVNRSSFFMAGFYYRATWLALEPLGGQRSAKALAERLRRRVGQIDLGATGGRRKTIGTHRHHLDREPVAIDLNDDEVIWVLFRNGARFHEVLDAHVLGGARREIAAQIGL